MTNERQQIEARMNPGRLLRNIEADLLWLTLENRWDRARKVLTNTELQAAIIAAQDYTRSGGGQGATAWSDPTGEAGSSDATTEVRAGQILAAWVHEIEVISQHVWFITDTTSTLLAEPMPPVKPGTGVHAKLNTITERIAWLLIVPHDRFRRLEATQPEQWAEVVASVEEAAADAKALRDGRLFTDGGKVVPSVYGVLESARKVLKVQSETVEEKPKQKPLQGCVSCSRNNGHFTAIDLKNHSARNMCRVCGDYASGEGSWLPIGAIQYMHRTGKQLTWKIIEEAKRGEKAS